LVECHVDKPRHIFAKEPSGPESVKASDHFRPEIAVICRASSLPGLREGLAGEAPTDEIRRRREEIPVDGSDVVIAGDAGKSLSENGSTKPVVLTLPGDAETGAFKSKIKSSNPREERTDRQHYSPNSFSFSSPLLANILTTFARPPR
jgi:hypothetical protein